MALSYIGDRDARVTWRDVLKIVVAKKSVTAQDLAKMLSMEGGEVRLRLKRLRDWGMIRFEGKEERRHIFVPTEYGLKVASNPVEKSQPLEIATDSSDDLSATDYVAQYPMLDGLGGVIDGPVALQRLVEIESIDDLPDGFDWAVEKKFDGWLCQTADGNLYSRRGKDLTRKFPPLWDHLKRLSGAHLVGELVYWDPSGKMSEPTVTTVAGTPDPFTAALKLKALPGFFQYVAFDLIGVGGRDVSKQPFKERRRRLESLVRPSRHFTLSPIYPFAKWRAAYNEALEEGGEGVVIKNMDAPYFWRELGEREPQPTGVQYKLKAVRSDDFIVFDSYLSEKDKLMVRFGQLWRGELVEVGDMNNFSAEIEQEIRQRLKRGPFVMEILFQERFPKPPGKLRNSRFSRFRDDKPIESVTLPARYAPKRDD